MVCSRRQLTLANSIYTQKKTFLFCSIGNHRTEYRVDHYADTIPLVTLSHMEDIYDHMDFTAQPLKSCTAVTTPLM
jgi:hypothetical protein